LRSLIAALAVAAVIIGSGCSSQFDDGQAFLSEPASRSPSAAPTSAPDKSETPVAPAKAIVIRGGIGTGQAVGPGQLPVLVYIDPGHGGVDVGTQGSTLDGKNVFEKSVSLAIAIRAQAILRADGIGSILSRSVDALPDLTAADYTPDGHLLTPEGLLHDLQNRINRANASGALVLLSIHLNAYTDPAVGGSETFYDANRPFAEDNQRFARLIQNSVASAIRDAGYNSPDRGIADDTTLQSDGFGSLGVPYNHLVLLGPPVSGRLKPTQIPGALSEPLFLSNPSEASLAVKPEVQEMLARAYATAIEQFLRG
jgi:N-acetylmuramoyl-L-alanine amidase